MTDESARRPSPNSSFVDYSYSVFFLFEYMQSFFTKMVKKKEDHSLFFFAVALARVLK